MPHIEVMRLNDAGHCKLDVFGSTLRDILQAIYMEDLINGVFTFVSSVQFGVHVHSPERHKGLLEVADLDL